MTLSKTWNSEKRREYMREYSKKYYQRNRDRLNAYKLEWKRKNPESAKAHGRNWYHKNVEKSLELQRQRRRRNRAQQNAQRKVHTALRNGKLQKQPCVVCGSVKSEAHHPDYSQPLKVTWICHLHHCQIHMHT